MSFPVNLKIENFPHRPALSRSESEDTTCHGIASNIANTAYDDWALLTQYGIYASLIFFGNYLFSREKKEKEFVCVALHLEGVFQPVEDRSKYKFQTCLPQAVLPFIPLFDKFFAITLGILYFLTLTVYTPARQEWYVFPTKDEESDFVKSGGNKFTDSCGALPLPVFLTYSQPPKGLDFASLAEIVIFAQLVYTMGAVQRQIYDWIDRDEYMNWQKRASCSYFDLHVNRSRVFNELMIVDWLVANVHKPLLSAVLTDQSDRYCGIRKNLKTSDLEELRKILESIESKMSHA